MRGRGGGGGGRERERGGEREGGREREEGREREREREREDMEGWSLRPASSHLSSSAIFFSLLVLSVSVSCRAPISLSTSA